MSKEQTKPVSTRVTKEEFAKALDGLINKGISPDQLLTISSIVKTSLLAACLLNDDPESPATQESRDKVEQLWKITKRIKNMHLKDLY